MKHSLSRSAVTALCPPASRCCLPWPWCCCCSWEWSAPMLPRHASRVTCCHVSRVVTCPHPEPVLTDHLPILILLKNKEISGSKSSSLHWSLQRQGGYWGRVSCSSLGWLWLCPWCGCPGHCRSGVSSLVPRQCTVIHRPSTQILSSGHTPNISSEDVWLMDRQQTGASSKEPFFWSNVWGPKRPKNLLPLYTTQRASAAPDRWSLETGGPIHCLRNLVSSSSAPLSKTPGSVYRVFRLYRVLYTAAAMQPADQADPGQWQQRPHFRTGRKLKFCPLLRLSAAKCRKQAVCKSNLNYVCLLEKSSVFSCCHCFQCINVSM